MSASFQRHPLYYFLNGTHIFRVENTLYKLHNDILMAHSALFKDMFTIGDAVPGLSVEGKSDTDPIFLEGEQQAVFDLFLDYINGRAPSVGSDDAYSYEELQDLLQFTDKYRCPMTRRFVIDYILDAKYTYHPVELIQLGHQFNIPKLFIGNIVWKWETMLFIALVNAKSVLEEYTRIIANEEPVILHHADDCVDPVACQENWHAVWWNGMGRFLLDGRNPQRFGDAVKRFRELQFGRMGAGCQKRMFQILDSGNALQHADVFIADILDELMDEVHLTDSTV